MSTYFIMWIKAVQACSKKEIKNTYANNDF